MAKILKFKPRAKNVRPKIEGMEPAQAIAIIRDMFPPDVMEAIKKELDSYED